MTLDVVKLASAAGIFVNGSQMRGSVAELERAAGGQGKAPLPRTLFGGLLRCALCGGAMVAVDARRYGCAAAKDRGPTVCRGTAVPRRAADDRLLSAVRDEFVSPEAILEVQRVLAELARDAAAGERAAERRNAARLAELEAEIGRLVDAIAAVGISPALQARLQAAESERAAIASSAAANARQRAGIDVARALHEYRKEVLRIDAALAGDRDAARAMLADLLGTITVEQREGQVWATLEMNAPAQLMLAGAQMGAVAGARTVTRRRIRIV